MASPREAVPKLPLLLLTRFSPAEDREYLGGDFEEIYLALLFEKGRPAARRWIRLQCLRSLPRIAFHALAWRCTMLKNFLKVALRNLRRQWLTSVINIVGLTAGFAVVLLIVLFIRSELAFDAFHEKAPRIYRLNTRLVFDGRESRQAVVAPAVAPALQAACPEIEASAPLFIERDPLTVGTADRKFTEKRFFYTEPEFFKIFSFPLIDGNPRTALSEPHSLVLTQETARRYFPRENPLGKTLTVSTGEGSMDYIVRGVAADVPAESHFHFDFLAPFSGHELSRVDNWFLQAGRAYVLLREGASVPALEAKFPPLIEVGAQANFGSVDNFRRWKTEGNVFEIFLQPILDIRLHSAGLGAQIEPVGDVAQIWIFGAIAFVILIIAVFNFVGLAAARSFQRALEVGVRKVMGSSRSLLVRQFLTESVLVSLAALFLSVGPIVFLVRGMTVLLGRPLSAADLLSWPVLPLVVVGALLTGLVAGAVPALVLASFRPARVLRGRIDPFRRPRFRGFLVATQFALSILLFIVTFVVSGQIRYVQAKDLGFDKDRLLAVTMPPALFGRYAAFKTEMLKNPEIASVALSVYLPGRPMIGEDFTDANQDHGKMVNLALLAGDEDFQKTLGITLAAGRFFAPEAGADENAVVINEEAARGFRNVLGWDDPLGKTLTNGRETMTIIGVLEDFHYHSLHRKIEPLAIQRLPAGRGAFIVLRTAGRDREAAVGRLREAWQTFVPDQPFESFSFDAETEALYRSEKRTASLLGLFSGIAVFLGCLGLFGLAAFSAERRTKEIGVRKVLGASRRGIVLMLLRQSGAAVLAANVVAWPAAFFFMRQWLRSFAYRMDLGPLPFLAAGALVLILAFLAAGGTALRAASADPVRALKYE